MAVEETRTAGKHGRTIARAQAILRDAQHLIALTGAGISTPSGIPDFRSPDSGLWTHADPLEVASIYAFRQHPQDFYDWIHPLAARTVAAQPNAAHTALAQMERYGPLRAVITQNIDLLHTRAGSETVLEILRPSAGDDLPALFRDRAGGGDLQEFLVAAEVPHCSCRGRAEARRDPVWEQLPVRTLNRGQKKYRLPIRCWWSAPLWRCAGQTSAAPGPR